MNRSKLEGNYDTYDSYNDCSYQLNNNSNYDIFQEEFANASETTNEQFTD
jgi:hypothetical protein